LITLYNTLIKATFVDVFRRYIMPNDVTDVPTTVIYMVLLAPLKRSTKGETFNCIGCVCRMIREHDSQEIKCRNKNSEVGDLAQYERT
jgi:hypothetical protein